MKPLRFALGMGVLGYRMLRHRSTYSFNQRVALITGGSRGLGLVIARKLVQQGAALTILARDEAEVERAAEELRQMGGTVQALVCDVRNRDEVAAAVERTIQRYGKLDILIHCAGVIQSAPLANLEIADFEKAMATHFWGAVYSTFAAAPHMRAQGGGRIVNIASIGGKVAVPHLVAYCASKFALVGFSDGVRAELARDNIKVTTVCPGLMRTGSHYNALFKGQNHKEFTWFSVLDASPLMSVSAEYAAEQIIEACRRGDAELVISVQAKLLARLTPLMPEITAQALRLMNRLLPDPATDPAGDEVHVGWESQSTLAPSLLTWLADRAAVRNNELKGHQPPV